MENSIELQFEVGTNDPDAELGLEVWIDDKKFFDLNHVSQTQIITHSMADEDTDSSNHVLKFVLKNKTDAHTVIDKTGNIVQTAMLYIKDIKFDNIDVSQLMFDVSEYTHNFNGHGQTVTEKFYGHLGCNGAVTVKFTTPVYLWLLENM